MKVFCFFVILFVFQVVEIRSDVRNNQTHITLQPSGIYSEIDAAVTKDNNAIFSLYTNDRIVQSNTIKLVLENSNSYAPPVLFALSSVIFDNRSKEDGAFWFYVAQLRARYDANRCTDSSADSACDTLNQNYGPKINKFTFANKTILTNIVLKSIEFVKLNNEEYDQRWINLHGMKAMIYMLNDSVNKENKTEKGSLSFPKEEWQKIKNDTISNYFEAFNEYVIKKMTNQ